MTLNIVAFVLGTIVQRLSDHDRKILSSRQHRWLQFVCHNHNWHSLMSFDDVPQI
jgi:hypothetical protein